MNMHPGIPEEIAGWPDRLEAVAFAAGFQAVRVVAECGSTQELARAIGLGSVVAAGRQTTGRGRQGRSWDDGDGRSVSISLAVPAATIPRLCIGSALAVLDAIEDLQGVRIPELGTKFPNDLVHRDGRKIAGILVECAAHVAVVGIGINVHARKWEPPVKGLSLEEMGMDVQRIEVMQTLLPAVHRRLQMPREELVRDFQDRHLPTDSQICLSFAEEKVTGILKEVDPFGMVKVDCEGRTAQVPASYCRHMEWSGNPDD